MGRAYTNRFADALWRWRKVKTQTDTVGTSIEKEFLAENTQLTTNLISRKLDELEKIVKQGKVFYGSALLRQAQTESLFKTTMPNCDRVSNLA